MSVEQPEMILRNPELVRRSWELQSEGRAEFITTFGSDLVVLRPDEASEQLRQHFLRVYTSKAPKQKTKIDFSGPIEQLLAPMEELQDCETVAIVYDEIEGLGFWQRTAPISIICAAI
jgi:hypothetical protein